ELKNLPPHLEYAFLEGTSKLPVIIAKDLKREEKEQLLKIRVNSKIHEVIKAEVIKLLDAGLIYLISDSPWMDKTTFTCPYGTFAYRRMPFGLCNAPGTFQRCMVAIFHDMIEKTMEVFMDDSLFFGDSFSSCLSYLDMMFKRCEDTNLVLNCRSVISWSNRALSSAIRSLQMEVYLRFLQNSSANDPPLGKRHSLLLSDECLASFKILKKKLTEAPILVSPDWDLPFELMCDASDFAVGAVLGKRKDKYFRPIHYASKTLSDVQMHYTTTEKELLAVVYAFE
ncbi:reverse transcriptase domain-containing protein, partial [Tanacetum coccineum]